MEGNVTRIRRLDGLVEVVQRMRLAHLCRIRSSAFIGDCNFQTVIIEMEVIIYCLLKLTSD